MGLMELPKVKNMQILFGSDLFYVKFSGLKGMIAQTAPLGYATDLQVDKLNSEKNTFKMEKFT